jgi:hypothetical protein
MRDMIVSLWDAGQRGKMQDCGHPSRRPCHHLPCFKNCPAHLAFARIARWPICPSTCKHTHWHRLATLYFLLCSNKACFMCQLFFPIPRPMRPASFFSTLPPRGYLVMSVPQPKPAQAGPAQPGLAHTKPTPTRPRLAHNQPTPAQNRLAHPSSIWTS